MTLTLATLIPGLLLLALGVPLLLNHAGFAAMLKSFPRSTAAAYCFWRRRRVVPVRHLALSPADFGEYRVSSSVLPRSRCWRSSVCPIFSRCAARHAGDGRDAPADAVHELRARADLSQARRLSGGRRVSGSAPNRGGCAIRHVALCPPRPSQGSAARSRVTACCLPSAFTY